MEQIREEETESAGQWGAKRHEYWARVISRYMKEGLEDKVEKPKSSNES